MTTTVNAYRASEPGGRLEHYQFELGELGHGQVDIDVDSCGICYSDVSMIDNDWGFTPYPITPGHEIVGRIRAVGPGEWLVVGDALPIYDYNLLVLIRDVAPALLPEKYTGLQRTARVRPLVRLGERGARQQSLY